MEKNELADSIAKQIVDECVWINAHILPHSEMIIEVLKILFFLKFNWI
jgi:hypothetical protein